MKKDMLIIAAMLATIIGCSVNKQGQNANLSLVGSWIEVMPANVQFRQGITMNADGTAQSIGMATLLYEKWVPFGKDTLILWGESVGNGQTISFSDTMDIIRVTPDTLILGKYGNYRITYYRVANVDSLKPFDIKDSLRIKSDLGEVVSTTYKGIVPAASCPGIDYTITLYHQRHSGDGVYKLSRRYIEAENGEDRTYETYGRQYTLRGDATDKNATVYQLIPFSSPDTVNLLFKGDSVVLLNNRFEPAQSKLNYTLLLQK